jgi:putative transposase
MGSRGRSVFGDRGHVFFLTTTVMNFDKVFGISEAYYQILLDSLKHQLSEHRAVLLAYVLMPSHIHLLVALPVGESVSDFMRDFKKFTSTRIRQRLEQDGQTQWLQRLRNNSKGKKKQVFKLWMDRFDDVVIYSDEVLRVKMEYIHHNPVKAGLVKKPEDWKFSSARNYLYSDQSLVAVATDWAFPR